MAPPAMMAPSASPNTQIAVSTTMASTRAIASTTEAASPWPETSAAAPLSTLTSQPGSPAAMFVMMPLSACGARFAGVRAK